MRLSRPRFKVAVVVRTSMLALLLALVIPPVASAHGLIRPALYMQPSQATQCLGAFRSPVCRMSRYPLQPSFSSSCVSSTHAFGGGGESLIAPKGKKLTPTTVQVWSFHSQLNIGSFAISWSGTFHTLPLQGPDSGSGSGTWHAIGLPSACRHGGSTVASGTVQFAWIRTGNELVAQSRFLGFP